MSTASLHSCSRSVTRGGGRREKEDKKEGREVGEKGRRNKNKPGRSVATDGPKPRCPLGRPKAHGVTQAAALNRLPDLSHI